MSQQTYTFLGYLLLDQVWMEYLIFDCANNELYSRCLHIVTVCACAEVEVPTLSQRWQHPMAEISGGAILPEGAIIPHSPLHGIGKHFFWQN